MYNLIRKFSLFYFVFSAVYLTAQTAPPPCPSNTPPADDCSSACIYCSFGSMSGTTAGYGPSSNSSCFPAENDQWIGFIAGASSATFTLEPMNCQDGNGLQMALYDDCTGANLACSAGNAGGGSTPIGFTANLIPGEFYFLQIDGWNGDHCDFTLNVSPPTAIQAPPLGPIEPIEGPSVVCMSQTANYSVPPVSGATDYIWTCNNPGVTINGQIPPVTAGNSVTVTFQTGISSVNLCAQAQNTCTSSSVVCKPILITAPYITNLPPITLCFGDLPYELPWGTWINSSGTYENIYTSQTGCDSVVKQKVTVIPLIVRNLGLFNLCPGECMEVCGETFCDPGSYNAVCTSYKGCDSIVNFTILQGPSQGKTGKVFWDFDGNGIFDGNNVALNGATIEVAPLNGNKSYFISGNNGNYTATGLVSGDTIRVILPPDAVSSIPAYYIFSPAQNGCLNFALQTQPNTPPGIATGLVYFDVNVNGVLDGNDYPAPGITVLAGATQGTFTNNDGTFAFGTLSDGDTIRIVPPIGNFTLTPPYRIYSSNVTGGYNYGIQSLAFDFSVFLSITNLNPGFFRKLFLEVVNQSSFSKAGTVCLEIPSQLIIGSNIVPAPTQVNGNVLCWDTGLLNPGQKFKATVDVKVPVGTPIGTQLTFNANVSPVQDDVFPANNFYSLTRTVVNSFDPNDKMVDPHYFTPNALQSGAPFNYTIRFQNTGNAPAEQVILVDTLDEKLNLNTLRLVASSHPCTWALKPGRVLEVTFDNINLPYESQDELGSIGFAAFSISPVSDLDFGDIIGNFADIFFDFNPPIRTNTVQSQLVYFPPITVIPSGSGGFSIKPNPASYKIRVSWDAQSVPGALIRLFDAQSQLVHEQVVPYGETGSDVNVAYLEPGMYLVVYQSGIQVLQQWIVVSRGGPVRRN